MVKYKNEKLCHLIRRDVPRWITN